MIHFNVIPGLTVLGANYQGTDQCCCLRFVDGGGHGLLGVPQLALSVSFPDDRQAVRLQFPDGRNRIISWQFLD